MSIRPIKRLIKSKPTLEGAGVHLRRAFGFGTRLTSIRFSSWMTSAMTFQKIIWQVFLGTHTVVSKPSPMCSLERLTTATAWGTVVPLLLVTCSG